MSPLPSEFLLPNSPEPIESDWARYFGTVEQGSRVAVVASIIGIKRYIRAEFALTIGNIAVFREVTFSTIRDKSDEDGSIYSGQYKKEIAISCDGIEYVEIESLPDELEEETETRKLDLD